MGIPGGYTGWVHGGLYRYPPSTHPAMHPVRPSSPHPPTPALKGFRGPLRWWGLPSSSTLPRDPSAKHPETAKRAPEAALQGWLEWVVSGCAPGSRTRLRTNTARFDLISWKLSQNRGVSSVFVEKACHSPYSQNRVQKSPLEILRFP